MSIILHFKEISYKFFANYWKRRKLDKTRRMLINKHSADFIPSKNIKLNTKEKELLKKQWSDLEPNIYFEWYAFYKAFDLFDPKLVALDIYYYDIIDRLNPQNIRYPAYNKLYYPIYFSSIKQPKTLLRRTHGIYFDENNNIIELSDVKKKYNDLKVCFIKPTKDSYGGRGVKKIDPSSFSFEQLEKEYPSDFLIQEALRQSKKTAIFNPDSVNTFRISTLYLNGCVTCCSTYLKFGQKGSFVDNLTSNGYAVGIDPDGHFRDLAIDYHDGFIPTPDKIVQQTREGLCFKDVYIPEVKSAIEFAMNNHVKFFPELGFIGWDIALNEKDEPVMIEANVKFPEITTPQLLFRRSAFDDRVDEVITYVKSIKI